MALAAKGCSFEVLSPLKRLLFLSIWFVVDILLLSVLLADFS